MSDESTVERFSSGSRRSGRGGGRGIHPGQKALLPLPLVGTSAPERPVDQRVVSPPLPAGLQTLRRQKNRPTPLWRLHHKGSGHPSCARSPLLERRPLLTLSLACSSGLS